jgi:hypothetical protein
MTALGVLGVGPSQALAATVLFHVIATRPSALLGPGASLVPHVRIADFKTGTNRPLGVVADG